MRPGAPVKSVWIEANKKVCEKRSDTKSLCRSFQPCVVLSSCVSFFQVMLLHDQCLALLERLRSNFFHLRFWSDFYCPSDFSNMNNNNTTVHETTFQMLGTYFTRC